MNFANAITTSPAIKVLIVDDNAQMREMTRFYVRQWAREIRECCDGSEALATFSDFQPDWVLMDWEMKQMDGLTATKEILKAFPSAKILMFTQFDDNELRDAATNAGASGFVLKDDLGGLSAFLGNLPVS